MIIYSSVDILGSLQTEDGFATQKSFTDWVKKYLLSPLKKQRL